jgi:hypothetical protein
VTGSFKSDACIILAWYRTMLLICGQICVVLYKALLPKQYFFLLYEIEMSNGRKTFTEYKIFRLFWNVTIKKVYLMIVPKKKLMV